MIKLRNLVALVLVAALAGCIAPSNVYHSSTALPSPMGASVLVLPPDVVISVLNAGGNEEPRADWSGQVQEDLLLALQGHMFENGIEFVPYSSAEIADDHLDVIRQTNTMMDAVEVGQFRSSSTAKHWKSG